MRARTPDCAGVRHHGGRGPQGAGTGLWKVALDRMNQQVIAMSSELA